MTLATHKHGGLVATLADRTTRLAQANDALGALRVELGETRRLLEAQKSIPASHDEDLAARTADLVATRAALVERNDELIATRAVLQERTLLLESAHAQAAAQAAQVETCMATLAARGAELVERTARLEALGTQHEAVLAQLRASQEALAERDGALAAARDELQRVRADLVDRTGRLEHSLAELARHAEDRKRPIRFALHAIYQNISYKIKRKEAK